MRVKFIDKVYMREVTDKEWYIEENSDIDGHIALKYIKEISQPLTAYSNGKKYIGLDAGYSILEYVPKNRGYNCRVFFDRQNRPLCYYFDINNGTGVENNMPWYDDLYLDVTMECPVVTGSAYFIRLDDEKEFKTAKKEGFITEEVYISGFDTAIKLMNELRNIENDIVNRSVWDIVRIKQKINLK